MKTTLIAALTASTLLASTATAGTISDTFTSFYAFGDSLTDDGKFPDAALHPLSDDGRFSDGPTWAEHLEDEFDGTGKNTANLAIGGATGDDENYNTTLGVLGTFAGQVATFAAAVASGGPLPVRTSTTDTVTPQATAPGANPLVSVFFGGNDMFQSVARAAEQTAALMGSGTVTPADVLRDAADAVADNIRAIAALGDGSTFDDFLVLSLPSDGTGASDPYNTQLALNLLDLQSEGLNIITYDTNVAYTEIILDTELNASGIFGITDYTTPCIPSLSQTPATTAACANPDAFALTDSVHPNSIVQEHLGNNVIAAVEDSIAAAAPVPLPAGGLLLIAGIGTLAVARRKKAA